MDKWIWLDMDGTFVDLYGVEGWLEDLTELNPRPYVVAESLYDDMELIEVLIQLKSEGWKIGVCSWSSKAKNSSFDMLVERKKNEWLIERHYDMVLDKVIVAPYGTCKADLCRPYGRGIIVDDEYQNRNAWNLGLTINANNDIIKQLKDLFKN